MQPVLNKKTLETKSVSKDVAAPTHQGHCIRLEVYFAGCEYIVKDGTREALLDLRDTCEPVGISLRNHIVRANQGA